MLEASDAAAVSNSVSGQDYIGNANWQVHVSHQDLIDSLNTIGRTPADLYELLQPESDATIDDTNKKAAISHMLATVAEALTPRAYFNESKLGLKSAPDDDTSNNTSSNFDDASKAKSDAVVNPTNAQSTQSSMKPTSVDQKATTGSATAPSLPPSASSSRGATVVFWPRDPLMGSNTTIQSACQASPSTRRNVKQGSNDRNLMVDNDSGVASSAAAISNNIDLGLDPDLVERVMAAVSAQLPFPLAPALLKGAVVAALNRLANVPQHQEEDGNNRGNTAANSSSLEGLVEAVAIAEIESARSRNNGGGSGDDVGGFPPVERLLSGSSPYLHVDSIRSWPQQPPSRQRHPASVPPPASSSTPTAAPPSSGGSSNSLEGFAWGPRIKPPAKSKSKLRPPPARSPKMNHVEMHRLQRQQLLLQPLALHADNAPGDDDLSRNALPVEVGPKDGTDTERLPAALALENGEAPLEQDIQSSPQAW